MKTYTGHDNEAYRIHSAFWEYQEINFIASGSEDGRFCFWDLQSLELVCQKHSHVKVPITLVLYVMPDSSGIYWIESCSYRSFWRPELSEKTQTSLTKLSPPKEIELPGQLISTNVRSLFLPLQDLLEFVVTLVALRFSNKTMYKWICVYPWMCDASGRLALGNAEAMKQF